MKPKLNFHLEWVELLPLFKFKRRPGHCSIIAALQFSKIFFRMVGRTGNKTEISEVSEGQISSTKGWTVDVRSPRQREDKTFHEKMKGWFSIESLIRLQAAFKQSKVNSSAISDFFFPSDVS